MSIRCKKKRFTTKEYRFSIFYLECRENMDELQQKIPLELEKVWIHLFTTLKLLE